MRRAISTSVGVFARCFEPRGPVLEIGSLYLPGYEEISDLRPRFPGREFVGTDIRHGLGVDRIEDAEALTFDGESFGTVLIFEVLEHLQHPDRALAEAHRVLRADGMLALSVPFNYHLHGFPTDFWRFTPSGVHTLLRSFKQKVVFALGPRSKPAFVFAVAAKELDADFDAKREAFEAQIHETFRRSRVRGWVSTFKGFGRDLGGLFVGRAHLGAAFFDPNETRGLFPYKDETV
jgi:SAM-dependent methyltransferase